MKFAPILCQFLYIHRFDAILIYMYICAQIAMSTLQNEPKN